MSQQTLMEAIYKIWPVLFHASNALSGGEHQFKILYAEDIHQGCRGFR
jgi:hypothetical protein